MPSSSVRALLLPREAGYGLQGAELEEEQLVQANSHNEGAILKNQAA